VNTTDPLGLFTLGACGSVSGALGPFYGGAEGCLTRTIDADGEDDIGVTGTVALPTFNAGWGYSGGFAALYQISDASKLQELGSWFWYVTAGGDIGLGASADVFWGTDPLIVGAEVGPSLGGGANAEFGANYTWVDQFNNRLRRISRGVSGTRK
jgi:hypothetical protein